MGLSCFVTLVRRNSSNYVSLVIELAVLWLYAQVLSLLPPYEGKSVLELGAGIGRFTGELAQKAGQLLALDFIDSVIKKVTLVDLIWIWK